jgi:uncharacterized protein YndB with AHSA1/START domain
MDAPSHNRDPLERLLLETKSDTEIVLTRRFRAPRALVFEAFSKPEHLRYWWGPRGYELITCEMDFREDGNWRFVQRAPDGKEYAFHGTYREISAPERLVYTFEFEPMAGHVSVETIELAERDGVTTLTNTVRFESRADRNAMVIDGNMEWGAAQTMERLSEHLYTMASADNEIVIARTFNAPRELVWRAWTDPDHVKHWWGPTGFTTDIEVMEVRPGGKWIHTMHGPDGTDYPNYCQFIEVVEPERIVFHLSSSAEDENKFLSTWTFEELAENRTRATIRMVFPSAAVRDKVIKENGAIDGGKQTLDRLAGYVEQKEGNAAA